MENRTFSIAAPSVWNSPTQHTQDVDSVNAFKARMKCEPFLALYSDV